ncbi:MAG TPA: rhomboid family intramembrane serine protease [Burkholderiales bacterium]|nr:rhomboid family intramembrane serine protease [Burkholderiales bacterium]
MLLPIGDQPNPRGLAPVTILLIMANVAVFVMLTMPLSAVPPDPRDPLLAAYVQAIAPHLPAGMTLPSFLQQISAYDLIVFEYGYRAAAPSAVSLFTAMFLHANLMHLLGNMLFLWIYGDNVEHRLGPFRFLFWYLATGVAATLAHAFFASGSQIPMVGASGAISGVLGFYLIWFPRNKVRFLVLIPFFVHVVLVPAWIALGFYLLIDNLLPFLAVPGGTGVAYGAHIGGFIAGMAVALLKGGGRRTGRL